MVPASCCLTDTQCVINNQTVVESVWPDDCYHKASLDVNKQVNCEDISYYFRV